ncbi:type II toxin-antitoxin system HipA family toxin [Sorangium sp. So ce204]|uniref:type II toxin-antitoxin system HipA family toxin n=1 Tax=Sorangium sp. So ce204 TaxID=3133288 RepID=UPI003F61DC1B
MSALEVRLGSVRVGILECFNDWDYRFSFDDSWLRTTDAPVLGQLFEDRKPGDIESTGNLICWFDHLLPQGPLRRAVAKQARCDEDDEFDLLQILGEDLPGAVVLVPCLPRLSRDSSVSRVQAPPTAEGLLHSSLAGAQYKLSVREGERGLTLPVQGQTGSYIAKFHDPLHKELPRVELATMLWARASGISVPPCRQARIEEFIELPDGTPIGDGTVFLIERFDRLPGGERVHIEDLGQVLDRPPGDPQYTGRYEHIAAVLAQLAPDDLRPYCERLVFCVLCGNTDAHLKNWSLI